MRFHQLQNYRQFFFFSLLDVVKDTHTYISTRKINYSEFIPEVCEAIYESLKQCIEVRILMHRVWQPAFNDTKKVYESTDFLALVDKNRNPLQKPTIVFQKPKSKVCAYIDFLCLQGSLNAAHSLHSTG